MSHAITLRDLLSAASLLAGLGAVALGLLMIFAAGMSDATDDGTGRGGCIALVVGAVLLGLGMWGLL